MFWLRACPPPPLDFHAFPRVLFLPRRHKGAGRPGDFLRPLSSFGFLSEAKSKPAAGRGLAESGALSHARAAPLGGSSPRRPFLAPTGSRRAQLAPLRPMVAAGESARLAGCRSGRAFSAEGQQVTAAVAAHGRGGKGRPQRGSTAAPQTESKCGGRVLWAGQLLPPLAPLEGLLPFLFFLLRTLSCSFKKKPLRSLEALCDPPRDPLRYMAGSQIAVWTPPLALGVFSPEKRLLPCLLSQVSVLFPFYRWETEAGGDSLKGVLQCGEVRR